MYIQISQGEIGEYFRYEKKTHFLLFCHHPISHFSHSYYCYKTWSRLDMPDTILKRNQIQIKYFWRIELMGPGFRFISSSSASVTNLKQEIRNEGMHCLMRGVGKCKTAQPLCPKLNAVTLTRCKQLYQRYIAPET